MQKKIPESNNPWRNARIKPAAPRSTEPYAARTPPQEPAKPPAAQRRGEEVRVYGRNACLAVFAKRPDDVRKVYLTEARLADFKPVLAWCVKQRIGYRVVENDDLDRLTETQHHEGVCFEVRKSPTLSLRALLQDIPKNSAALLIWLDGVGNPHNVGALLRSAANFGARAAILPAGSPVLPGAAMRVAEGGAEAVPLAQAPTGEDGFAMLHEAGFAIAATVPRAGEDLYTTELPSRLVLILGAEGEGMSAELIRRANLRLTIPGTGAVESLNVSASAAVLFAEYWRQHR